MTDMAGVEKCGDCDRTIYWCEDEKRYRHLHFSYRGCFLIPAEALPEMPDVLEIAVFAAGYHRDFYCIPPGAESQDDGTQFMPDDIDVFWEIDNENGDWMVETNFDRDPSSATWDTDKG